MGLEPYMHPDVANLTPCWTQEQDTLHNVMGIEQCSHRICWAAGQKSMQVLHMLADVLATSRCELELSTLIEGSAPKKDIERAC